MSAIKNKNYYAFVQAVKEHTSLEEIHTAKRVRMYAPAVTPKHITESNLENNKKQVEEVTSQMSRETLRIITLSKNMRRSYPKKSSTSAT